MDLSPTLSDVEFLDGTLPSSPLSVSSNEKKRKRGGSALAKSPRSMDREEDNVTEERNKHKLKRSCNECRQQKLRCDVVPDPFKVCSRCRRLRLECRIDANFKRVGKRSKNAEMEREIVELRKQLAERGPSASNQTSPIAYSGMGSASHSNAATPVDPLTALHQGAVGSLLDLRNSKSASGSGQLKSLKLGHTSFDPGHIQALFTQYFYYYHPFLPLLDPDKSPDEYYDLSPLLYWTIVAVAARRFSDDPTLLSSISSPLSSLVWSTIAGVPQNYHVVKALCLLCTWPLPTKSTSTDPTFMLSGLMMQIALQTGLHRPSHVQDFSRIRIELRDDDVRDRLKTWACCNIVAQNISTGYGQPPKSVYDWTLMSLPEPGDGGLSLPANIYWRLQIERFCNKVSQSFYNNGADPIGITGERERGSWISVLVEDYRDLEGQVTRRASAIDTLYLKAAGLHMRLYAFFDSSSTANYLNDLLELHFATVSFLKYALEFESTIGLGLKYVGTYIMQMILAGGFTLMKLLNSFFARHIDLEDSRMLFNNTIRAIRLMGISNNDLPARLAEVLAQLWRTYGAGMRGISSDVDGTLQLKIRCRMSMSLVFDSIWRWREEFQFKGDGTTANLDSAVLNNPTNPDIGAENDAVITHMADHNLTEIQMTGNSMGDTLLDYNYEVFDPLTWMLDGNAGFPYNSGPLTSIDGPAFFS